MIKTQKIFEIIELKYSTLCSDVLIKPISLVLILIMCSDSISNVDFSNQVFDQVKPKPALRFQNDQMFRTKNVVNFRIKHLFEVQYLQLFVLFPFGSVLNC